MHTTHQHRLLDMQRLRDTLCIATCTKHYSATPRRTYFAGPQLAGSCGLKEGTEAGELCIALLNENCCHSNRRGIRDGDAFSAKLV